MKDLIGSDSPAAPTKQSSRRAGRWRLRRLLKSRRVLSLGGMFAVGLLFVVAFFFQGHFTLPGSQSYEAAHVHFVGGRYADTVLALKAVPRVDGANLPARVLLGRAYLRLGYAKGAEEELRRSLSAGADLELVAEPLGNAYLQQGKHETLFATLDPQAADRALQIRLYTLRGDAHLQLRDLLAAEAADDDGKALADLQSVRKVRPGNPQADYLQALILTKAGDNERAQQMMERAGPSLVRMQTSFVLRHPPSLLLLGIIRYRGGNFDEAYNLLTRFVKLEPYHLGARKLLAGVRLRRGLANAAIDTLKPVLQAQPAMCRALS
ncbi:MAG: tetratricopeptide repeat protein [Chromatiales bacterium]|nr:tetratricopeptide repeat protein [Chromatiales bacterium]